MSRGGRHQVAVFGEHLGFNIVSMTLGYWLFLQCDNRLMRFVHSLTLLASKEFHLIMGQTVSILLFTCWLRSADKSHKSP
jgi:hypothetical protein